ncbi:MAG: solute carrier 26 family protein, partial [Bacteroidetes bacterium]
MNIKSVLPFLEWLPNYKKSDLKGDLSAGITVGVMLIPQGMAYAMIAGLPPIYGLYACTVPLVLYALLGTSRQQAVGPVAMVSLLTATGVGALAEGGTELYIMLAITLAFLVGVVQFLLGVFRLGFLVNFLSVPVISGFTSAAALIIGLGQLKHLLGVPIERSQYIHKILWEAIQKAGDINWATFAIGLGGILLIVVTKKWKKSFPGQLSAVIFGILVVWIFGLTDQGVAVFGDIPAGLPSFSLPSFNVAHWEALFPMALTISIVGFMGSIAVAKAIEAKHKNYKVRPNQELIALGVANIGGSFFQSFPITGGFSRTAVNDQAGAKTGLATIISASLIVLTLLFLTPLFYYLPKAILASGIMVAVFGLIDFKEAAHLWRSDRTDFYMLLATFLATLSFGIETGIGVGVALSLGMVIFRTTRPHYAVLGQVPGTHFYRNVRRFGNIRERDDLLILRFDAQLYFANVNFFKDTIEAELARKGPALKALIINADSTNNLDSSAAHAIADVLEDCRKRGIRLLFTGVKGPVRDAMSRAGLIEKIGPEHFFMSVQEAVDWVDAHPDCSAEKLREFTLQTN